MICKEVSDLKGQLFGFFDEVLKNQRSTIDEHEEKIKEQHYTTTGVAETLIEIHRDYKSLNQKLDLNDSMIDKKITDFSQQNDKRTFEI